MWTLLLLAAGAVAAEPLPAERGTLTFDARLPAEVLVDGTTVGKLYREGRLSVDVSAGIHELKVYTNGDPDELEVVVPAQGDVQVLVGRTGLSVDQAATRQVSAARQVDAEADADVAVQVRMAGPIGARLYLGSDRYEVPADSQVELELTTGEHKVSIRNEDGTVVWASGTLVVEGPEPVVVQLSEGRMPEVSGRGAFASKR